MRYEDRNDVDLTIRITKKQFAMLAVAAEKHGISKHALVRNMIKLVGEDACQSHRENITNEAEEIQSRS